MSDKITHVLSPRPSREDKETIAIVIDGLNARLAIATKALEEIADKDNIGISLGAVARRALEQIKGTG